MRVRAIKPGFYDIHKNGHPVDIKVGDVFDYREAKLGQWMVAIDSQELAAVAKAKADEAHKAAEEAEATRVREEKAAKEKADKDAKGGK